jgi:hypothetical protein
MPSRHHRPSQVPGMCQHSIRGFRENPIPIQVPANREVIARLDLNTILKDDCKLNDPPVSHIR